MSENTQKELTRDLSAEHSIQKAGGVGIILGVFLFIWGSAALVGWTPKARFEFFDKYEPIAFIGYGLLLFLASGLVLYFDSWGRWLQILLSLTGLAAVYTLHPILILSALVQLYLLTTMLSSSTAQVFSRGYRVVIVEERLNPGFGNFMQRINWPIFFVFMLTFSLLVTVIMIIIFSIQSIQLAEYSVTKIGFLHLLNREPVQELVEGNPYRIAFTITHQKMQTPLSYQLVVKRLPEGKSKPELLTESYFLPNPDVAEETIS
ncbi:MAG: hypothetical protein KDD43_15210, partial [Bdellovibrionales bacterium]|nr:hypothetical protein [Bdellovibrionales bacterium]